MVLGNAVTRWLLRHVMGDQRHIKKSFFSGCMRSEFALEFLEHKLTLLAVTVRGYQAVGERALGFAIDAKSFKYMFMHYS